MQIVWVSHLILVFGCFITRSRLAVAHGLTVVTGMCWELAVDQVKSKGSDPNEQVDH